MKGLDSRQLFDCCVSCAFVQCMCFVCGAGMFALLTCVLATIEANSKRLGSGLEVSVQQSQGREGGEQVNGSKVD